MASSNYRQQPPRQTVRQGNRIKFLRKINAQAHREFMGLISYCFKEGHDNIILDFSKAQTGYPNGMVPLIASIDSYKRSGMKFKFDMPEDSSCKNLFRFTNWAHLLMPEAYPAEETQHNRHLTTLHTISPLITI